MSIQFKSGLTQKQETEPTPQFSVFDTSVVFKVSNMASSKSGGAFVSVAGCHKGSKKYQCKTSHRDKDRGNKLFCEYLFEVMCVAHLAGVPQMFKLCIFVLGYLHTIIHP